MELSKTEAVFRREMHEKLENDFNEFVCYQKLVLDTLNAFHNVCIQSHIDYYLAYGTLLGVIRDKGQIPWDYDVDLWVKYEDVERLISALDENLPKDYYYVTRYKSKKHRHFMMRIAPKGYSSEVLHVDVFWLWGAPSSPIKLKRMKQLYNKCKVWGLWKFCPIKYLEWRQGKPQRLYARFKKEVMSFIPIWYVDGLQKKAVSLAEDDTPFYIDEYGLLLEKKCFDSIDLVTLQNGMSLSVPVGYDNLLKQMYGNYNEYLNICERMKEFESSLCRIRELGKG
ncbi:LicD family protein [uncultured Bacteroides sp.]|uniref:LicD family protein n=1 Tax=uncultured Bacteroides sp. TaxID=162156 RepID=UPI0032B25B6A